MLMALTKCCTIAVACLFTNADDAKPLVAQPLASEQRVTFKATDKTSLRAAMDAIASATSLKCDSFRLQNREYRTRATESWDKTPVWDAILSTAFQSNAGVSVLRSSITFSASDPLIVRWQQKGPMVGCWVPNSSKKEVLLLVKSLPFEVGNVAIGNVEISTKDERWRPAKSKPSREIPGSAQVSLDLSGIQEPIVKVRFDAVGVVRNRIWQAEFDMDEFNTRQHEDIRFERRYSAALTRDLSVDFNRLDVCSLTWKEHLSKAEDDLLRKTDRDLGAGLIPSFASDDKTARALFEKRLYIEVLDSKRFDGRGERIGGDVFADYEKIEGGLSWRMRHQTDIDKWKKLTILLGELKLTKVSFEISLGDEKKKESQR